MRSYTRLQICAGLGCALLLLTVAFRASAAGDELKDIEDLFGEDWYGLYMFGGQKVGYAVTDLGPTEHRGEKAYKLSVKTHLEVTMFGTEQTLDTVETRIYGPDGALEWLSVDMPQPLGQMMQFVGEVVDGKFKLTKKVANQEQSLLIEPPNETLRDALEEAAMISEDTKVGDSHGFARVPHLRTDAQDGGNAPGEKRRDGHRKECIWRGAHASLSRGDNYSAGRDCILGESHCRR